MTGSASPVSADSSRTASWPTTAPSAGTTSPARTDDDVAGPELVDLDLLDRAVDVPVRDARGALDEEAELAAGAAGGPRLERGAAGHHQGDDRGGEELAEREGPDDRDEGDRVDADVSAQQRAGRGDHERDEHHDRPDGPGDVGPALLAEQPERRSGDDRAEGDRRQAPVAQLPHLLGEEGGVLDRATSSWRRCGAAAVRPGCARRRRRLGREGRSPG